MSKMEEHFKAQLDENALAYKRALNRIISKYSKLQYQDDALEVDLNATDPQTMEKYMELSKNIMSNPESKNLSDSREESLSAQDITSDSQFDFTLQDDELDESHISTSQSDVENDGTSRNNGSQLTVSLLEESQRDETETELQPEDQDEELEMTLRSQGSSLVELYPSMITQIGRAWQRQHVSEAAGSVLRRYRRWRRSNRSNLNNTFNVTLRNGNSTLKKKTSRTPLKETFNSPPKRKFSGICGRGPETTCLSLLRKVSSLQDRQAPGRDRGSPRREQNRPILVMDFSCPSEASEPERSSLNETFTVAQHSPPSSSQLGAQPFFCTASPSRLCYPPAKAPLDLSLRMKRLPLSAHSAQTTGSSIYASETPGGKERSDIYGSPVRQSPLQTKLVTRESLSSSSPHRDFSPVRQSPLKTKLVTRESLSSSSPHHDFSPVRQSPLKAKMIKENFSRSPLFRDFSPVKQSPLKAKLLTRASLGASPPRCDFSPARQSPIKARTMKESFSRSPSSFDFSRSPKSESVTHSRESMRSRLTSMFLPSPPPQYPVKQTSTLDPQESRHSHQSQPQLPQSVTAAGCHKLRRHLSFESSLPRSHAVCSQKDLDYGLEKLYHKFVCQNKSSHFKSTACKMCARSTEASRGHSSSALAALALSPHRSLLRKRHRELEWENHPKSKRTYSPGSKCYRRETLPLQDSAATRHAACMPRGWHVPAAEFSDLGESFESKMATGYFTGKW